MMLLDVKDQCHGRCSPVEPLPPTLTIPEVRPSFLDPDLVCEPWIDRCPCEQLLIFFVLNRPIAVMPGSSLDHESLNTLLDQLRHRMPRQP